MPRKAVPREASARRPFAIDFGEYRETSATIWRPIMPTFAPAFRLTEQAIEAMRSIERADQDLERLAPARGGLLQRMRKEALARNAFATASIEGNPLSLSEVESLLRANPTPAAAHDKDELEILNYAAFMGTREAKRAPRAPADVLAVHGALFRGVLRDAGSWKKHPNFIGMKRGRDRVVVYVPARPSRVEPELSNALAWLHEARDVPPLVRALLFHHELEAIHPFRDGNGRTGRALTPMILHELGYKGSAFAQIDYAIYESRDAYYEELAKVERGGFRDYTGWLERMLDLSARAFAQAVEKARFQRALPGDLTQRQRDVAEWFARLRDEAASRRVKFNDVHHAFPEIAERTLKRDLATLRDRGVLDVQGERKGTTYRLAG